MKKRRKAQPVSNDHVVTCYTKNNSFELKLGLLKKLFISHKLDNIKIEKVYLPGTNSFWHIKYRPTKGFTYERL